MDGKVTGLIKNGERESEVQFLFFLGFRPSLANSRAVAGGGGGTVEQTYSVVPRQSPRAIISRTGTAENQNSGQARGRATEGEKRDMSVFFILCNDNDIIDMNNAMSATTPFLFFPFL